MNHPQIQFSVNRPPIKSVARNNFLSITGSGFQAVAVAAALALSSAAALAQSPYSFWTLAGLAGNPGSGDGPARAARFSRPAGIRVDLSGNLYVSDTFNHTIRKIAPDGMVTTLAGLAGISGSADGTGSAARFNFPVGLAADSGGNLYVADTYNHTIRKINPTGAVITLAGFAGAAGTANGTGTVARFFYPRSGTVDSADNLYVADQNNHTIRKITPNGVVSTLAGSAGSSGYADGTGNVARFNSPAGVALDRKGTFYVADGLNHTIRKITAGGVVSTLAGMAGNSGSADGTGNAARFNYPSDIAVDSAGNVYVTEYNNHTIRKITPAGMVSTLGGLAGRVGSDDGPGSTARFNQPVGIAVDIARNVYVTDTENNTIRNGVRATAPADCAPAPIGLVAAWRGETNANDEMGNRHGTLVSGLAFESGMVGQAFRLDGLDDGVRIPFSTNLNLWTYSVELWVKPLAQISDFANQELLFGQAFGKPQLVVRPGVAGLKVAFLFMENISSYPGIVSTNEILLNEFSHVAGTWDGITMRLYVNGMLSAEAALGKTPAPSSCPFCVGGFVDACGLTGQFFNGVIDEIGVYNRPLTASEVQAIYTAGSSGKCPNELDCLPAPAGMVAWWPGEGDAADLQDAHSGQVFGDMSFSPGEVGQAFNFDGMDDYVLVPAAPELNVASFTVEGWIWPSNYNSRGPILGFSEATGPIGVLVWHGVGADSGSGVIPGSLYANLRDTTGIIPSGDHVIATRAGVLNSNDWTHFAVVYDQESGIGSLYVNGSLVLSSNLGNFAPKTARPVYIGYVPAGNTDGIGGARYRGKMDEISLYNRALSATEILAIYSMGSMGKCRAQLACAPPPSGMVAWWPGEGDAADIQNAHSGQVFGNLTFGPGKVGQAFNFDGMNDYVLIPAAPELNVKSLTIEGWIWPSNFNSRGPILGFSEATGPIGVLVWHGVGTDSGPGVIPGSLYANLRDTTGVIGSGDHVIATGPGVLSSNDWNHFAVIYDQQSGVGSLYVNGSPVLSRNLGKFTPKTAQPIYIGYVPAGNTDGIGGARYWGKMDEISLYNRALSGTEILEIYSAGSMGKCQSPAFLESPQSWLGLWGGTATFSVSFRGTEPVAFQWLKDGTPITGATNASLILTHLQLSDEGNYSVRVTNDYGSVTSEAARLWVNVADVSIALHAAVTIQGLVGQIYGIQYVTDLIQTNNWKGLANITLTIPVQRWFDPEPVNQLRRFYRVVPGPITVP